MSHIDAGPLAGYNSLLDPHLAGYFSNIRMRKHLVKSGLITRKGNIVSENTYRLNMARKEHKKHVRDLLAQAIVHKTLDMERTRQVAIKQKLEEIAKVEMVRRVKESCGRHGDEDILPYLRPPHKKGSRPSSVPSGGSGRKGHEEARPVSAPSKSHQKRSRSSGEHRGQPRIVVDDKGMPHSAQTRSYSGSTDSESRSHSARSRSKGASRYPTEELDDRHLYSLNSQSLRDYTMARYDMDSSRGPSPYRLPQLPPDMIPTPPPSHTPRSPRRPRHHGRSATSQSKSTSASRSNKGQLMLHRQEPAMKHQERVQTLCDVNMHYFGKSLSLDYERFDPRDEVMVEQQHCGGNTLIVFREKILPGSDFTFTSRRHRGYPFSLTFYVNGVIDCRLSTCCEYKHQSGARLGGKQGHFGMIGVEGAAPCYKCQLNEANSQKKKKKRRSRRKAKDADEDENVCVPVEEDDKINKDVKVHGIGEDQDRHISKDDSIEIPVEDDQESTKDDYNYSEDDFDEDDKKSNASSRSSSYSSRSSRSTSSSTSSSSSNFQDNDDVLWNILVYTSKKQFAGTDANVYIILYGDTPAKKDVRSDKITLNDGENNFEKGTRGEFKREAPNFEKLTKIRIGHDNSGAASAWHLDRVVLENTCTGKTFTFHCNNWVSGSEDDTAIERELYPAGSDESKQASKIPKVRWHVKVYTSDIRNAGTDSVVYILLSGETKDGEVKESDKIILDNSQNNFERGQCDEFQIETYDFVKLTKLRIGHHNNGLGPAWHLDKIILENAASGKSYTFYCKKWLADNKDDQAIERELFPAGSEEARKSDMARKAIWNVKVYTSDIRNAGTDSDVYILLSGETKDGEVKESDKIILDNSQNNFERGQCDEFQIETYDFVKLTKLRIGHNNNGLGAAWHLDKVEVRNVSTGDLYTFSCNKWLADDKDDCAVERALLPDSQQDSAEQQHQQQSDGEKHDVSDDGSSSLSSSSASASSASASSASSSRSSLAEDQHMVVAQTANVDGTSAELDKESVKDEKSVKVHEDDRQRSSDTESCSSVSDKSSDEVDSDSHKDDQESDKEEKQSIRADNEADGDNKQSIREVEESDKEDKELFTDDKESDKSDKESTRDDEVPDKESATDDKGSDEEYRESARGDKGYDKEDKESTSDDKGPEKENKSSVKDDKGSEEEDKESVRGDKGSDKEDEVAAGEDTNSNNKERESVKDEELTRDDKGSDKEDKTSARDHNESEEEDKESVRDDMASDKGGKVSAGEDTSSDKKERESIRDVKESDKGDKDSTRDDKDSDKKDEVSEVKQQNDQQQGDENKDMNEKEEEEFQRTEKERKSPSSSSSTSYTSGSSSSDSGKEEDNSNNKQMTSPREQSNNSVKENDKDATERPPENVNHVLSPCEEVVGSIRPLIEGRNNIELVNKKLSEDQFKELCDVIKETGEIQALTLRNLNINYRVLEKLTDALLSTKSDDLEMLNLNLNNITPVGASYLAEIVKKKPKLQILLLQNTALGDEGINVLVNALLEVNNKQTEAIYEAAKGMVSSIIASAVETEPAAESVNSDVTSGGGSSENERLVSALEGDQRHGDLRLEQLDVADCQIEDRGIKSLARLVSANTKLDHLCLTGNQKISPAAWRELGEALHSNTNLRECSLDYTDLRDEGVDAFLDGAVGNRGLQSLDLEGNRIGDAGGRMILDFIHNHPNLKEVNLAPGNHIDKTIMDQIQDILDQRN